ncbi:MAG: DUF1700 domain-containing protein [Coriobacteriales bacterium]
MNIREYEARLTKLLGELPSKEREEAVSFYMETLADRIDDGASEADAVASLPTPEEAAQAILNDRPADEQTIFSLTVRKGGGTPDDEEAEPDRERFIDRLRQRRLSVLEWVAVIVASPLWLSILAVILALVVVLLAAYVVVWVLIACVWIIGAALVAAAPMALLFVIWGLQLGYFPYALVNVGYGLFSFGAGMWVMRGALKLTRAFLSWQKRNIKVRMCRHRDASNDEKLFGDEGEDAPASVETAPTFPSKYRGFFRVCTGLVIAGVACVAIGFLASGMDWRVFLTSLYTEGNMYIGGVQVDDPNALLFAPVYLGR